MAFYEKGNVRIPSQEAGSGFPLLVIPGGGQNPTIGFMSDRAPFNATEDFKDEYRASRFENAATVAGMARMIEEARPAPAVMQGRESIE